MKYQELCEKILELVGGKENIVYATHCITRLRFNLKDKDKPDLGKIKALKGVLGAQFSGEQLQIIIGQHVGDVYQDFLKVSGIQVQKAIDENLDAGKKQPFSWKQVPTKVMDYVSGSISPILPIIVASGIFKLLASALGPSVSGLLAEDNDFIKLCTLVGDAGFYFYPIFLAWSAAKKRNTSIPIALFLGAVLLHPTFLGMVSDGTSFTIYGLPVTMRNYSSQFLPSILMVWVLSYVYDFFTKISPKSLRMLLVPVGTMLVMLPLTFCAIAPLGYYIGSVLGKVFVTIYDLVGPFAVGLIGAFWYFLVATGMHSPVAAVGRTNLANIGYDNMIFVGATVATYSLIGVGLAYIIKCDKDERAAAIANAVSLSMGGVSEPTIFGTLLRYKQAMAAQIIGGFAGGFVAAMLGTKFYFAATANILAFLGFSTSMVTGLIGCAVSAVVSFGLSMVLGFKEKGKV